MKKKGFLFFLLFFSVITFCNSQSFTLGLTGQAKNTWLVNTAVLGASVQQEAKPSFGFDGGVTATMYFQQQIDTYFGVGVDVLFGNFKQRYSGRVSNSPTLSTYNSNVNLLFIDLPVYGKMVTRYGAYIEAGVQFSLLVNGAYKSTGGFEASTNVTNKFAPFYYGPLLGVGTDFPLTDDLYFIAGLRFMYGISDLKGVDGQGNDINIPQPNQPDYTGAKTHAASLTLNVGVYYRFDVGEYGKVGQHRR